MHIPDGLLSTEINVGTAIASAVVVGLALVRANNRLEEKQVPLLGMTAAFIFAAQMLNFPIAGGTSGHLLGAVLAAVLVGPLNGALVMTIVLAIQCLLFADGGLTALGANVFNMAVLSVFGGYGLFFALSRLLPKNRRGFLASVAVASWFSVVLGASAFAVELAASGKASLSRALSLMAGSHALIGLGEAFITTTVLSVVLNVRPDLVAEPYAAAHSGTPAGADPSEIKKESKSQRVARGVLA
jgi:cobalt/nickel transport system permease protein